MSTVGSLANLIEKSVFYAGAVSALSMKQALVISLVAYLVCFALFFRKKGPGKNVAVALLFLYVGVLFSLTIPVIPPSHWHIAPASTDWAFRSIIWTPFLSASGLLQRANASGNWTEFLRLVVGNVLVFLPLGILVPLINPEFRCGRMFLLAVLVPVCIEFLQLVGNILAGTLIRTVETEDVILNAAGCMLGYLLYALVRHLCKPRYYAKHYR